MIGFINAVTRHFDFPARLMMAGLFLFSSYSKLTTATATQAYMESHGLPGVLLWPAAFWEFIAGTLLVLGLGIRPLAIALAGWCLLTASIFHTRLADPNQVNHLLKNLTMAGAFMMLAKNGSPDFSLDSMLAGRARRGLESATARG